MAHILGYHITQFLLFIARFFPSLIPWVGRWAWWLSKEDSEVVDDGYKVLNFDCLVCGFTDKPHPKITLELTPSSSLSMPWNGQYRPSMRKLVFRKCDYGSPKKQRHTTDCGYTSPSRSGGLARTIYGLARAMDGRPLGSES
jgi:hypothetical protein